MRGQFIEHGGIIGGLDDDSHIGMVLGCGADHRRAANVDVLDAVVIVRALGDGFLERIKIHDEEIDRLDVVRLHRRGMVLVGADRQQAAMHARMQRLDAAVHHFGKAGQVGDIGNGEPRVLQRLGGAAGGDEIDAERGQRAGEFNQAGFVGNRQQSAGDAAGMTGHPLLMSLVAPVRKGKSGRNHSGNQSGNSGSSARFGFDPGAAGRVWRKLQLTLAVSRA